MIQIRTTLLGAILALPTCLLGQEAVATADTSAAVAAHRGPLEADTILRPAGGPLMLMLGAPGEGVTALRISVPLVEGPAEAGAGRLLRDLALKRLEGLARPVGARVTAARTPWGLAYTVEGASADFEYLAYLIREAVAAPNVPSAALEEARIRLGETLARSVETPGGQLRAELRNGIEPGLTPSTGTSATLPYLRAARLREVWARSHQASGMTLVVSAPFVPEVVLAATRGLGAPEEWAAPPLDAPAPAAPPTRRAESLRSWYGEAYRGGLPGDPHGPVAAILLAQQLEDVTGAFEADVELWELSGGWALALTGAAYAAGRGAMRSALSTAVENTIRNLTSTGVEDAVARVRRQILLRARTPAGLVTVVGRAAEPSGDPRAAHEQVAALQHVDLESTTRLFESLLRQPRATAEIRP